MSYHPGQYPPQQYASPQQQYPAQQQYAPQQQQQQGQYAPPPQQQQLQQQPQQQHLPPQSAAIHTPAQSDHGAFPGGSYTITHRDTNAVLNLDIQQGASIKAKPGVMIHMSGTIDLSGKMKFSMKKLFTGGEMNESTFAGYGKVALAPTLFGDIITLHLDGRQEWNVGKDAYLARTSEVVKDTKSQGFTKAMFSGEDLFIYRVTGQGLMWLTSFGAVDRLDLQPGEQHIVDNGHLVAWSCGYTIEKAGGSSMTGLKTGEGLVCRFTGPGTVYLQTRNQDEFETYIRSVVPRQ